MTTSPAKYTRSLEEYLRQKVTPGSVEVDGVGGDYAVDRVLRR